MFYWAHVFCSFFCWLQTLPCLKEMDLSGSQNLIEMPDLSKATNLETLKLRNCYSLVKLPSSIPHPNKLTTINLKNCRNLETIPIGISLKSLEVLNLYGCSMLRTIPLFSVNISHLSIDETSIEEIPSVLQLENFRLENLSYLSMKNIKSEKLWERVQVCSSKLDVFSLNFDNKLNNYINNIIKI